MQVVHITSTDPYRNLAAEEYFLKQRGEDFFLLWQNEPCVVVGKNQNTFAQINSDYVNEHDLPVVRRLTGGGAVYHDLGNVNYSVIMSDAKRYFGDYTVFCRPLIKALSQLGVDAVQSGRNDLLADGKKFCGNAQTLWHGRILHHGCILFSSDIGNLSDALRVDPLKIRGKGIDSVRSRVTNLAPLLQAPMTAEEFCGYLYAEVLKAPGNTPYTPDGADCAAIESLRDEKYSTFAWNFGYPKDYSFQKDMRCAGGTVTVQMDISENRVSSFYVSGDFFGVRDADELSPVIVGAPYEPGEILSRLKELPLEEYMSGVTAEDLIKAMF